MTNMEEEKEKLRSDKESCRWGCNAREGRSVIFKSLKIRQMIN